MAVFSVTGADVAVLDPPAGHPDPDKVFLKRGGEPVLVKAVGQPVWINRGDVKPVDAMDAL